MSDDPIKRRVIFAGEPRCELYLRAVRNEKIAGPNNYAWQGDNVSEQGGRKRALRLYPSIPPCVSCGNPRSERHHKDGNTANNEPDNIVPLCRKCHMALDGRLEQARLTTLANSAKILEAAAEAHRSITECPKAHPYSGDNLYINPRGARVCRQCVNDYKRNKRQSEKQREQRSD